MGHQWSIPLVITAFIGAVEPAGLAPALAAKVEPAGSSAPALAATAAPAAAAEGEHAQQPPNPVMPQLPPVGGKLAQEHGLPQLLAQRTTNFYHASASQAKNMTVLARRLNGVVIEPGETFSYYRTVGPYTAENGFFWGRAFSGNRIVPSMGGGVCQGASTLYSALLRTGLPIVERHQHSLTVPYLPPGEDATVAGSYLDFRFRNDRKTAVMLAAAADPARRYLTVAVWGKEPPPAIAVKHEVLATYPYQTARVCVQTTPDGQPVVQSPGQPGVKARTWLEVKTPQGVIRKDLGVDTYRASPRVVQVVCGRASH